MYWTNFNLPNKIGRKKVDNFSKTDIESLSNYHDYNFRKYKGKQRTDKIARNLVDYQAGRIIFETMLGMPLVNLSEASDQLIAGKGLAKVNSNWVYPFRRYKIAGIQENIYTASGVKIDFENYTLQDHFNTFKEIEV